MSSGSITRDNRVYSSLYCGSSIQNGLYFHKQWTGTNQAGTFHLKKKFLDEHPYEMTLFAESNPIIEYRALNSADWHSCTIKSSFVPVYQIPDWTANDEINLIAKLSDKVRGHGFNAAVFVAEGRESLQMISETARTLACALHHLKRRDFGAVSNCFAKADYSSGHRARSKRSDDLNRRWLEYEYGWRTLIKDMYDAGEAAFATFNRPMVLHFRASTKLPGKVLGYNGKPGPKGKAFRLKEYRVKLKEDFSILTSLGLTHPDEVLWEKLPFSFVADWALPIGNFLKARSFLQDIIGRGSLYYTDYKYANVSSTYIDPLFWYPLKGGPYTVKDISVSRGAKTGSSVPYPSVKDPIKILSWRHAIDSLALLFQHRAT